MQPGLFDRILVTVLHALPLRLIARGVYRLSRSERPWLKNTLIEGFLKLYDVNTEEAGRTVPDGYVSFNDFFTRELIDTARPIESTAGTTLCPADGRIAQFGHGRAGTLVQAKGHNFSVRELLADAECSRDLGGAAYATIYLAPHNYHRVHMPWSGQLTQTVYVPGKLYSVNARTTAIVPNLYAVNERLVCCFEGNAGPFAVVLVGAMNVASISTAWADEIPIPRSRFADPIRTHFGGGPAYVAGDYVGHFNLGSTVVMVGPREVVWREGLRVGEAVRMGQPLGTAP